MDTPSGGEVRRAPPYYYYRPAGTMLQLLRRKVAICIKDSCRSKKQRTTATCFPDKFPGNFIRKRIIIKKTERQWRKRKFSSCIRDCFYLLSGGIWMRWRFIFRRKKKPVSNELWSILRHLQKTYSRGISKETYLDISLNRAIEQRARRPRYDKRIDW